MRNFIKTLSLTSFFWLTCSLTFAQDCSLKGTDPNEDWDCDGIVNKIDLDDDNDGILDVDEVFCDIRKQKKSLGRFFWQNVKDFYGQRRNPQNPLEYMFSNVPREGIGTFCNVGEPRGGNNGPTWLRPRGLTSWNDFGGNPYVLRRYQGAPNAQTTVEMRFSPIRKGNYRSTTVRVEMNGRFLFSFNSRSDGRITKKVTVPTTQSFLDLKIIFISQGDCWADEVELTISDIVQEWVGEYCDSDFDKDGLNNQFDLDSDNDGCFDMAESGAFQYTNDSIVLQRPRFDSLGTNGLADFIEAAPDTGVYNYNLKNDFLDTSMAYCPSCFDTIPPYLEVPADALYACFIQPKPNILFLDDQYVDLFFDHDTLIFEEEGRIDSIRYVWRVTDGCENTSIDSTTYRFNAVFDPKVTLSDLDFCNPDMTFDWTGLDRNGTYIFNWTCADTTVSIDSPTSKIPSFSFSTSGTYVFEVEVKAEGNCIEKITAETTVTKAERVIKISGDTEYCEQDVIQLKATGGDSYTWISPGGIKTKDSILTITNARLGDAGLYKVVIPFSETCIDTFEKRIFVNRTGAVKPIADIQFCSGSDISITLPNIDSQFVSWIMNDSIISNDNKLTFSNGKLAIGNYDIGVEIRPVEGCKSYGVHTFAVVESDLPLLLRDTIVPENTSFEFSIDSVKTIFWQLPDGSIQTGKLSLESVSEDDVGYYTYNLQSANGCFLRDSFNLMLALDDDDSGGDYSGGDYSGGDYSGGDYSGGDYSGGDDSGGDDSGDDDSGDDDSDDDHSDDDHSDDDHSDDDHSDDDHSDDDHSDDDHSGGDDSGGDDSGNDDSGNDDSGNDGSGNDGSGNDGSGNDGSGNDGSGNDGSGNDGSGNDGSGNDDSSNDDSSNDDSSNDDSSNDDSSNDDSSNDDSSNDDSGNDDSGDDDSGDDDSGEPEIVTLDENGVGIYCFQQTTINGYLKKICHEENIKESSITTNGCLDFIANISNPTQVCYAYCEGLSCDTVFLVLKPFEPAPVLKDDAFKLEDFEEVKVNITANDEHILPNDSIVLIKMPKYGEASIKARRLNYIPFGEECNKVDTIRYAVKRNETWDTALVEIELPCRTPIFNTGISPNGDGINDYLIIKNIEKYPSNELFIYNRYGNLVYRQKNYNNTDPWKGLFIENQLPTGVYFYVLKVESGSNKSFEGYIYLQ